MMHYEKAVVSIVDMDNKALREFESVKSENGRKSKVFIPFDTEYKFLIKNQADKRVKVEIEIDGTQVLGTGLIISSHATEYIERFLDVSKKFMFVKASHESVGDPTNRENGIIKVRIAKEKTVPLPQIIEKHIHHYDYWKKYPWYPSWHPYDPWNTYYAQDLYNQSMGSVSSTNYSAPQSSSGSLGSSLRGMNMPLQSSLNSLTSEKSIIDGADVGATIEGGSSNQTFGTTNWNGDDENPLLFTFLLVGKDLKADEEYQKYLALKKKFEG